MANTVILSFKASTSPLFKKALEAAKQVPSFHTSGDFFVVEFDFDEMVKVRSTTFPKFERIYMMAKSWKESRLRVLSNTSEDSYEVYKMILDRYLSANPEYPDWIVKERKSREHLTKPVNPFKEGTDDWANWEIDNYQRRQKQ